jgi:peroxiredoxin
MSAIKEGQPSPAFNFNDIYGSEWSLDKLRGRSNVLLTFFPKCFTGGCAGQLASLQKEMSMLEKNNTQIIAIQWMSKISNCYSQPSLA